jgi:hypothetical protein|tara:strand:- start:9307 stop:9477 length:171 start_codon:yes stop_codon:yes gene_type:complete
MFGNDGLRRLRLLSSGFATKGEPSRRFATQAETSAASVSWIYRAHRRGLRSNGYAP